MFSASKTKGASSGYQVANSLRFRSSASAYLSRTPAAASNRMTWTWSGWVKRGALGIQGALFSAGVSTATFDQLVFNSSDNTLTAVIYASNAVVGLLITTQVFRDPSAWYHIVVVWDSTSATSANRLRMYVNGAQVTAFGTNTQPTQNAVSTINSAVVHTHGDLYYGSHLNYFDGYLAEVNFIDGQALTPAAFGMFDAASGVWKPTEYGGTYGTNGFKLNFSNGTSTTTLGYDSSGNSNNWTTNNISLTAGTTYDWMLDSPTPLVGTSYGVGNYAVLNPLTNSSSAYVSNGNLTCTSNDVNYRAAYSSIGVSSGKWYCEVYVGLKNYDTGINVTNIVSNVAYYYLANSGAKWDTSASQMAYGATYTTGDTIGVAFDADAGSLTFYKNGTSQGVAFTGLASSTYQFLSYTAGAGANISYNFGQRPFAYTPPTGFKSLCTFNLPAPAIANGANYMAATTYTGTGATQSISNAVNGVSFQPDFVWIKSRSAATDHALYDVIRGAQDRLESNTTDAAVASDNGLTAFGSAGFTVNTLAQVNTNSATYIGWQWKAGGTAVTNTAGSITSSVSANTTAGFSVVTFTAQSSGTGTIGHGLGIAPSLIITKQRATAGTAWTTYHQSVGNTGYLVLNTTAASAILSTVWNNTSPTSNVFTLGSAFAGAGTMVAYCFVAISGFSAFGSYTGNGSADGPFVYCGFRPRFVMIKCVSTGSTNWSMWDSSRNTYNLTNLELNADNSNADFDDTIYRPLDLLSNGFKIRGSNGGANANGGTYVYACFAENPFQNALAR